MAIPKTWEPQRGPQTQAFETEADITGYGGAAGGGKSDLVLGLAHRRHDKSIVYRREFPQLQGMIDRSREIYHPIGGKFSAQPYPRWRFPDGRSIEFGAVNLVGDEKKYQGRPHDFLAFDEATEFAESQIRFLLGWMRSAQGIRCRAVMTFNPPTTAEGRWVISFFAPWLDEKYPKPARAGEIRYFVADKDGNDLEVDSPDPVLIKGEMMKPMSRTFIPARLDDNAHLSNTNYRAVLQALPEPLRSQMLAGDFRDFSGTAFFDRASLLVNDQPVDMPVRCDAVYAVIDSATKTGMQHDGTAVKYFATNKYFPGVAPVTVLDWDYVQISGDLLIEWLPSIFDRLEELARLTNARAGSVGVFIEDKNSGTILLQAALRRDMKAQAIDSKLTAMGKSERAMSVSGYVAQNMVKYSRHAYEKVVVFKNTSKNYSIIQVLDFRIGDENKNKPDDLLDTFTYGIALALGNSEGF